VRSRFVRQLTVQGILEGLSFCVEITTVWPLAEKMKEEEEDEKKAKKAE
jgi:hypothetical protein